MLIVIPIYVYNQINVSNSKYQTTGVIVKKGITRNIYYDYIVDSVEYSGVRSTNMNIYKKVKKGDRYKVLYDKDDPTIEKILWDQKINE